MKFPIKPAGLVRITAFITVLDALLSSAFPQGSLTPPGAPAPTMKTLEQIEPRTPISSAPFTISQSGSYYLTTNVTVTGGDALSISASGVTLDLNGFTISSTAPAATGIAIRINGGLKNLVIQNGFILGGVTNNGGTYSGPGFGNGIIFVDVSPANARVTGVTVTGCRFHGIYLAGDSTLVESCAVRTGGGTGIWASTVRGSSARDCGGNAIVGGLISDCLGESSGSGAGITAVTVLNSRGISNSGYGMDATTAQNCHGFSLSGTGISAFSAQNCYGSGNETGVAAWAAQSCWGQSNGTGPGIRSESTAHNCHGFSASGPGISTETAENCYGVSGSSVGISADVVQSCRGSSNTGIGVFGTTVLNSTGYSGNYQGISCYIAENCYGYVGTGGTGLTVQTSAHNCIGWGGNGIFINPSKGIATNCHGVSTGNGIGLQARIAIGCYGESPNGYGINVTIANSCYGTGMPLGVAATHKYNMP